MNQRDLPPPALGRHDSVFSEPWQAQAFAITIALHQNGLFSWGEWTERLSEELKGGEQNGSDYYHRWLSALEKVLSDNGIAAGNEIDALAAAWQRAAEATPHGKPILLENDPESGLR